MESFENVLLGHMRNILDGKEAYIPNPYGRLNEVFNLHKGRYILIGSNSGIGKTSLVDDMLLRSYKWIKEFLPTAHFEVSYFSMERSIREKYAKWLSWLIYEQEGIKLPSNIFSSGVYKSNKLSAREYELAEIYTPQMNELISHFKVYKGIQTPQIIKKIIDEVADRVGVWVHSDRIRVYKNGVPIPGTEFNPSITKVTVQGNLPYIKLKIGYIQLEITPDSKYYILKNPNTFIPIVIDHVGKTKTENGITKKSAIDELDNILSDARDTYGFMPIVISQFNRDVGDVNRLKLTGGNLEPILEDFKDSGNPGESADLVISPFDPYRYKSYNNDGLYKGYNITSSIRPGTLTPEGIQRFRSLHILKNSYGPSQLTYGMKFMGEVMHYSLLPLPESKEMEKVYEEIALGN